MQDHHQVTCRSCGAHREFVFDIGRFHGQFLAEMKAFRDLPPEITSRLEELTQPTMEGLLVYLKTLTDAGDTLALDFVADAVAQFRRDAGGEAPTGEAPGPTGPRRWRKTPAA